MRKIYIIEYHSFIDVITNSSSEMFISSDKKIIEFFQEMFGDNIGGETGSYITIMSWEEYAKDYDLNELKESNPKYFQKEYEKYEGKSVMIININSEDYDFVGEIMKKMNFKSLYD